MQAGKSLDKALIYLGGEETPLSQLPEKDVRARLDTLRSAQFRTQAVEAVAMPLKRLSSLFLGQPEPGRARVSKRASGRGMGTTRCSCTPAWRASSAKPAAAGTKETYAPASGSQQQ